MPFDLGIFQTAMTTIATVKRTAIGALIVGGLLLTSAGIEAYTSLEQAKLQNRVKIEQIRYAETVELKKIRSQRDQSICHDALLLAGDDTPNKLLLEKNSGATEGVVKLLTYCSKDGE